MSVAKSIYKGSASFGRFMAMFWAVIVTLVCIVVFVYGFNQVQSVKKYKGVAKATILSKNCDNAGICTYNVKYTDEKSQNVDTTFKSVTNIDTKIVSVIDIVYDMDNKKNVRLTEENTTGTGYLLMFGSVIVSAGYWFWVWVTRKYEFAASASGVSDVFNMFD